jgi:predicted house-cleaning noncanonical NTP pyrophosphatase (MazG superfamily)
MNKAVRKNLKEIIENLEGFLVEIEEIKDSETEKFENLNEGLQQTEMGIRLGEQIEELENAFDYLSESIEFLNSSIS